MTRRKRSANRHHYISSQYSEFCFNRDMSVPKHKAVIAAIIPEEVADKRRPILRLDDATMIFYEQGWTS